MLIELRAPDRLRGPKAVDLEPVLAAVLRAARQGGVELTNLRVVCDWLQYKHNFREPVSLRRIEPSALQAALGGPRATGGEAYELAVDLRRRGEVDLEAELRRVLAGPAPAEPAGRVYLEPWVRGSASCVWEFNSLYWRALGLWEQATGREYEQALPGGESDARNVAAARELILELFAVWDALAARRALPEELYVLELGVGNGNQARVWLDQFRQLDQELGREYYRRLHYLMGDYSPHVLERARASVQPHAERVSCLVVDATRPSEALGFLRGKAFLIYMSNVYDNLPTDELARLEGHTYLVQVRAYLPSDAARQLAAELEVAPEGLRELIRRLLRLGPELLCEAAPERFPTPMAAVSFWAKVWEALRLEERYLPLEALDSYPVAPGVCGEVLRPILEANGDARLQVSNGAAASFAETLPLLHPLGLLCCHDLFVTDLHQYRAGFRGPGKYDGSVVNWVNGPLLAAIGRRQGYEVRFSPFAHRAGSHVVTLTARVGE